MGLTRAEIFQLTSELTADPSKVGYASMENSEVVASINTKSNSRPKREAISSCELLQFLAVHDLLKNFEDAAANRSSSARSAALAVIKILTVTEAQVDLNDTEILTLLDALVSDGVMSATDKDNLLALGTRDGSRAEELFSQKVTLEDVRKARA